MIDYNTLSAIEIHNLVLKSKEKHEELKEQVFQILNEINEKKDNMNNIIKEIEIIENEYVVLMEHLLSKQDK